MVFADSMRPEKGARSPVVIYSEGSKEMKAAKAWRMKVFLSLALAAAAYAFPASVESESRFPGISDEFAVIAANATGGGVNVEFIVTDPEGRRLGFDPRTRDYHAELTGGYDRPWFWNPYEGKAELVRDPAPGRGGRGGKRPDSYTTFAEFGLVEGEYTVEVVGMGPTEYSVRVLLSPGDPGESMKFRARGVIDKDKSVVYRFTYRADPEGPAGAFEKLISTEGLKQEVVLFHENRWIRRRGVAKRLLAKVEAAEDALSMGNGSAARDYLGDFMDEVRGLSRKQIAKEKSAILVDDARYLADRLCGGPAVLVASSRTCE